MTLTIEMAPELEARLKAQAARHGVALPEYVRLQLERLASERPGPEEADRTLNLADLYGAGAEMWQQELAGADAQGYVNRMREAEWNRRNV